MITKDPELLSTGKLPDFCQKDDCKSMESEPVPNQESSGKSLTTSGGDDAGEGSNQKDDVVRVVTSFSKAS